MTDLPREPEYEEALSLPDTVTTPEELLALTYTTPDLQPLPPDLSIHPLRFATADLIARHDMTWLLRYIRRRLPRERWIAAEDVLQEVCLGLLEYGKSNDQLPTFEKKLKPLAKGVAAHKIADAQRILFGLHEHEQPASTFIDTLDESSLQSSGDDPQQQTIDGGDREEASLAVDILLSKLNSADRTVIKALLTDPDQDTEQLRQALALKGRTGMTLGATRVAKHRALETSKRIILNMASILFPDGIPFDTDSPSRKKPLLPRALRRCASVSVRAIHEEAVKKIHAFRHEGEENIVSLIPYYIGPWTVAGNTMKAALTNATDEAKGLIIYSHAHLLPQFRAFMRTVSKLMVGSLESGNPGQELIVDTPAAIMASAADLDFDYVISPVQNLYSSSNTKELRYRAAFLLHLVGDGSVTTCENYYTAPGYKEVGGDGDVHWTPSDSIRYLQEYRFMTGQQITTEEVNRLAAEGQGPELDRLCGGFDSFAALQHEAGYSFGPVTMRCY